MSDVLVLEQPAKTKAKAKKRGGKVRSVLRVNREGRWIGDVLLDRRGRVWRHVEAIPADVVLKAMAAFTRGEVRGELIGRRDGLSYAWHEVVEQPEAEEAVIVVNLADAA
jgi:hypothetical protein